MEENNKKIMETLNKIYDDIDKNDHFPSQRPTLAHYTTLQVGESILKDKQFWLSNPLYMNDYEELAFGFREGNRLVNGSEELRSAFSDSKTYLKFISAYNSYAKTFEDKEALDVFIGCFCKHDADNPDGLLSMWRGYGHDGKGIALIFDTSRMEEPEESAIILAPVEYMSSEDRIAYLDLRLKYYSKIVRSINWTIDNIHMPAFVLFERIKMYALFSKHVGFKEECEWRIVYMPSRDQAAALNNMIGYHNGARGIEPKMFLDIGAKEGVTAESFDFDNLLQTILLGPNGASVLTQSSFKRMLKLIDKAHLIEKVRSSQIPYRPLPR